MRTFTRYILNTEEETKTIQEEWDENGRQMWTYFDESVKQIIDFFLSQRLRGRNLDVGGGWYLPYPNSDVVDISPVCLEKNIAPPDRKHVFDLDSIAKGEKLPFQNGSFDSATIISVWQYLLDPLLVVEELKRVLKPGAELYIVNGQSAGVSELVVSNTNPLEIKRELSKKGYDTLSEPIPTLSGRVGIFESVCAAMPHYENGTQVSRIKDKKRRTKEARNFDAKRFLDDFGESEKNLQIAKLMQVRQYPITRYSRELLERIEGFSQEYSQITGHIPIFFSEMGIQPDFDMALLGNEPMISFTVLRNAKDSWGSSKETDNLGKKYGIRYVHYINYFDANTLEDFMRELRSGSENLHMGTVFGFLASVKLNEQAVGLSKEIESFLSPRREEIQDELNMAIARRLHFYAGQCRQRRSIDELIERKKRIEANPEMIVGWGRMEAEPYSNHIKRIILSCDVGYVDDDF